MSKNNDDKNVILQVIGTTDEMMVVHDRGFTTGQTYSTAKAAAQMADKTTPPIPTWLDQGWKWAKWGDTDRLPTIMREKVEQVPIAGAVLDKKVRFLQGNGLYYFKTKDLQDGPDVQRAYIPEVEDFLESNRINEEWFPAQCADYCLPFNCFSEIVLSKDRKKITSIYHIAAEHARLSRANARNQVDWLLYSYHFPFGTAQTDAYRVAMPMYKWYDHENFLQRLQGYKFGWHTRFPTPGLIYYARPWWLGLFKENGWLDVSSAVPGIVAAMQKNQIKLKYVIAIPETYFRVRYMGWDSMEDAKRQEIIDAKVGDMNTYLTGGENVLKSISYVFKENELNGSAMGMIKLEAVDDKAKTDTWVPDSFAADSQIVQGLGMDPSQIGLAPQSGKMGAGSGSDKMQSYNIMIALNTPEQRQILEPLNKIAKWNNWGIQFAVDHTQLTTQNNQESGMMPSTNTVKPKA